jgi:hypothetical protein
VFINSDSGEGYITVRLIFYDLHDYVLTYETRSKVLQETVSTSILGIQAIRSSLRSLTSTFPQSSSSTPWDP